MYDFQKNLKLIRIEKGYTQQDIAIQLDTTTEQYNRYERCKRELPLHHAITLSEFYRMSLDDIFKK